jgi:hypothetical protein
MKIQKPLVNICYTIYDNEYAILFNQDKYIGYCHKNAIIFLDEHLDLFDFQKDILPEVILHNNKIITKKINLYENTKTFN